MSALSAHLFVSLNYSSWPVGLFYYSGSAGRSQVHGPHIMLNAMPPALYTGEVGTDRTTSTVPPIYFSPVQEVIRVAQLQVALPAQVRATRDGLDLGDGSTEGLGADRPEFGE